MIIDVHNHFFPPAFLAAWDESPQRSSDRALTVARRWSESSMVEDLDRNGVDAAVISIGDQRPRFDQRSIKAGRTLARQCNEFGARLAQDHTKRVGLLAFLPMPDVEGSLLEAEYALDQLKAVGVGTMTSYVDRWIGDPTFVPLLEEMNRRKAIMFCHPRAPAATENLVPHILSSFAGILEFPFDTGRAIVTLLVTGALARFPDIRWIFCHAGAVIPVLAHRIGFTLASRLDKDGLAKIAPCGVDHELQRLYWDTALIPSSPQMKALLDYSPLEHIVFGSDYPFCPIERDLEAFGRLSLLPKQEAAIKSENILRLFPQFTAVG